MKIYRNFDHPDERFTACIGFFDGVHLGHRYLLDRLRQQAALPLSAPLARGASAPAAGIPPGPATPPAPAAGTLSAPAAGTPSAVVTFANHPRLLVQPDFPLRLIDTLDERLHKLAQTGVDACFLLDFTDDVRRMTAATFLRDVLARRLGIVRLLVGYDHRFGSDRTEGFDDYVRHGAACGIEVLPAPERPAAGLTNDAPAAITSALSGQSGQPPGQPLRFSSSEVRRALAAGDVERAALLLGQPHRVEGIVVPGHQLGRRLGFPTANLAVPPQKALPATGVYAATAQLLPDLGTAPADTIAPADATTPAGATASAEAIVWPAMVNVGYRPTVAAEGTQTDVTLEAHVIGFEGDLYGRRLALSFRHKIRDERRMASLAELTAQLAADRQAALSALSPAGRRPSQP